MMNESGNKRTENNLSTLVNPQTQKPQNTQVAISGDLPGLGAKPKGHGNLSQSDYNQ